MGTHQTLRQFLMSLCDHSHWKYAVFWKLNHHVPLILTWEDGYCDITKPAERKSDDSYFNGTEALSFSGFEITMRDIGSRGCPIELAVANLSCLQYALGEGLVGEVAYTGNHAWVFLNDLSTGYVYSKLVPEWTEEWLLQISLGVKTVLLVPVPDGVLQLGSLETVAEEMAAVGLIRDRYDAFHTMMDESWPFTLTQNTQDHSSLSQFSGQMENIRESTGLIISQLKTEKVDNFDDMRMKKYSLSASNEYGPLHTVQHLPIMGKGVTDFIETTSEDGIHFPYASTFPSQTINTNNLDIIDTKMFGSSCIEEELLAYSLSSGDNVELFGKSLSELNSVYDGAMAAQLFGDNHIYNGTCEEMNSFFRFSEDYGLNSSLPSTSRKRTHEQFWNSSEFSEDPFINNSSLLYNKDLMDIVEPSWFTRGTDAGQMSEAVVTNLCTFSDDALSSASDSVRSCTTRQSSPFLQPQVRSKVDSRMSNLSVQQNLTTPVFLAKVDSSTSLDGMTSSLTDEGQKDQVRVQSGKGRKLSNLKSTRGRSGNIQKQRPRDRQLIQDRVKELRELVPNGAKCSIDGLLDRTVKHMLHLRNVADQAEKLKSFPQQEVTRDNNSKLYNKTESTQNGTSWGFELGNELRACPIVVKDLEKQGQMLIEVPCDDHGLFLEITQLIKRLDLTILKGVMENHSGDSYAHFVVEATKGFHRMEVFLPLLHLLQHARNRISNKI
ncbi:transcription factor bHLH155 isoform X1 [Cannabis sativa]|uniref:transcription factor bHLH155 isoform X1 n=1 Tax=Cannabis sativa TaxID=3483 RepID=UPI0011DFA797|nr:transcription factor bHLH155 isoform X1 [Cannabis sativa]